MTMLEKGDASLRNLLFVVLLTILAFSLSPSYGECAAQITVERVDAKVMGKDKAELIGQSVTVFPSRLHQSVGYLFLYEKPAADVSGVSQLEFARSIAGKEFVVDGLFSVHNGVKSDYYWKIVSLADKSVVWVKDNRERLLADEPFVLAADVEQDKLAMQAAEAIVNQQVWVNLNVTGRTDFVGKIDHLEHLIVTAFKSTGPFSDQYVISFLKDDGTTVEWKVGYRSAIPVYNHKSFLSLYRSGYYANDPVNVHPGWTQQEWQAIKLRKIIVGWSKELVDMSWGKPIKITGGNNKTGSSKNKNSGQEVWEYDGQRYLKFKDNVLVSIRIPKPQPPNNKGAVKNKQEDAFMEVTEALAQ